jgi:iron complex transport system substrate-binding protein
VFALNYQSKLSIALIVLAIVLSGMAVLLAYESYVTSQSVKGEVEALGKQISNASSQISALGTSLSSLQNVGTAIQSLNSTLSQRIDTLSKQIEELKYPIQVYDALNRTVFITQQPQRIVSLAPSITEILFAINASNLVVGVDDYSNYPPAVLDMVKNGTIQRVGGFSEISLEKVISLKPDLVVGSTGVQYKFVYSLSQMGITSLSLKTESIDEIFSAILLLGKITNHYQEALTLVYSMKQNLLSTYSLVTSKTQEKPSVAYLVWINPIFVAGGGSFWSDVLYLSGGTNAFQNVSQAWPMISWEDLVSANPKVIVLSEYAGGFSNATQFIAWARSQPGGNNIEAIKEGRVYMFHGELNDIASRPSPRVIELQLALSLILHPDVYGAKEVPNDLTLDEVMNLTSTK